MDRFPRDNMGRCLLPLLLHSLKAVRDAFARTAIFRLILARKHLQLARLRAASLVIPFLGRPGPF